jgi:predicted nucleotidyltransferase
MDYVHPVETLIPGVQGRVLTVLARTEAELTMRSVAELAGVSANQATVVLNRLVRLGIVERRDVGASALVRLVRENEAARSVLSLVDLRQGVLARLAGEARKIRPAPACLVVFGSFARGDAHENSDIDVLAVPPSGAQVDDGRWTAALGQLEARMDELPKLVRREREPWRTIVEEGVVLVGDIPSEIRAAS